MARSASPAASAVSPGPMVMTSPNPSSRARAAVEAGVTITVSLPRTLAMSSGEKWSKWSWVIRIRSASRGSVVTPKGSMYTVFSPVMRMLLWYSTST